MSPSLTCPKLQKDKIPARGETRIDNGGLEFCDETTRSWKKAVRITNIRERLIAQAAQLGSYTHARARGKKATDETAYLPIDRDHGYDWNNRPAILFQLYAGDSPWSQKPRGPLMDGDRVVLDPYDHPIRDFPELPVTLSSEEKGLFIEYYLRRNRQIKAYDLMARMDVGEDGQPPFVATINERATKFRAVGACLTWNAKPGSDKLKEALLMLLGDCLATNTFALGCDFTKEEVDELRKGNKGKFPNRRRKEKREAEVVQEAASNLGVLHSPSHHRATTSNNSSQPYSQGHKRRIGQSTLGLTADSCQPSTSKRPRLEVEALEANDSRQLDRLNSRKRKAPESPVPMLDFSKRQCQRAKPHRDSGSNAHSSSPLFQTVSHGVVRSTTAPHHYINRRAHLQGRTDRSPRLELMNGKTAPIVGSTKTKTTPTTFHTQDGYNDSQIILQEAHAQYPLEQVATPSQIPTYRRLSSPHQESLSGQYLDQYNYQPQYLQAQSSNGPQNRHQTGFPLSDQSQYQNTAPVCRLGSDSLDSSQPISRASLQQSNQSTLSEFDPVDVYDADKYLPDPYRVSEMDNLPEILQDRESLYGGPATTQPAITTHHQATNPDVHPDYPPSTIMTSSGPRILNNHDACQWTGIISQSENFVNSASHAYQSPEIASTSGPRLEDVDDTLLGSEATPDSEQGVPNHDLAVPFSTTSSGFGPCVWSAGHAHPSPFITPDSEPTFLDIDYIDYALLGSAPQSDGNLYTEGGGCVLDDGDYPKPRSSITEPGASAALASANERTCMDLCQGTGTPYPYDLIEAHKTESYAS